MAKRERLLMDIGWRFQLGDVHDESVNHAWIKSGAFTYGGANPNLDDSEWRVVDLPHDFVY